MRKTKTRLLSMLLALVLMLDVMPIGQVFAADVDTSRDYGDGLVVDGSAGWNSTGGDNYLLNGQFDVTITFKNEPFKRDTNAWSNFVFELFDGANTEGYTLRADNYGWIFSNAKVKPPFESTNSWNYDWAAFKTMCTANPIVTLNLKKTSNTTVTAYMEFKPSEQGTAAANQTYTIKYPNGVPASMKVRVGADGGKVTILKFRDNTARDDQTIPGKIGSVATPAEELLNNTRIVYTFHNKTLASEYANWLNFVVEVWGSTTFGITARADAYDWGYNGLNGNVLLKWESNIDDGFASALANADVTVAVERVDNKITLTYDFKSSEGKAYHIVGSTSNYTLPDVVYVHLTGEQVELTNIRAQTCPLIEETSNDLIVVGGVGSAKTQNVELPDNTRVIYTFHNTTLSEPDNAIVQYVKCNFAAEVEGTAFGITTRADTENWGYNGISGGGLLTWESNIDDGFAAALANSDVTVTIDRIGNKLTLTYDVQSSDGKTYHIVGSTENYTLPDVVYAHLTGEHVQLFNVQAKTRRLDDDTPPDEPSAEYTRSDLTIGGFVSAATAPDELKGNFKIIYTFNNASTDSSEIWNSFATEVWGDGFGITTTADARGWGYNGTEENCLTWEADFDTTKNSAAWAAFKTDMENADVTVTIQRIGKVITFTYDIVAKETKNTYHIVGTTKQLSMPYDLYAHLTGEKVKLSNIRVKIYNDDQYDPSLDDLIKYEALSNRVTVHDPSIVKDTNTGIYYIFGSHRDWATTTDLINWQKFSNNINRNYSTIFSQPAEWSARGGPQDSASGQYEIGGNLWAPDVIWNPTMNKWCMYMSVNGDKYYTSTVLLTADNIMGPYTYVGPVVYSGFTSKEEALLTDFYKVVQDKNSFPSRYTQKEGGRHSYGMNAIDPCVSYDEKGDLWMTYGSWFGGIYMIKLDPTTGLRDYSYTYTTETNKSDEYQGFQIAGGHTLSGEASYIEKIGKYWYLFMSYGGFVANGGYNMRVFRSENITGPYTDSSGNSAIYTKYNGSDEENIEGSVGNRLMTYYRWSYMEKGQVAQGHNSAFQDSDGRSYVIYHTRFDDGTEGHQVRVHQLFVSEDGWLVAAPFEYAGESLAAVNKADVAGTYEVLFHTSTDHKNLECVTGQSLTFNSDGTLSGALQGTWELNGYYATLKSGDKTYKGVFVKQKMEDLDRTTLCFTVIDGSGISAWGYKYPYSDEEFIDMAAKELDIPIGTFGQNITLPTAGLYDTSIAWSSDNTAIITSAGKVTVPNTDTVVTLTAAITSGSATKNFKFPVKVFSSKQNEKEKYLIWEYFTGKNQDLSGVGEGDLQYPNPFNSSNVLGISIYNGVSIEFEVTPKGAMQYLSNILSLNTGASGGLFFNGGSYLGYNNGANEWFDANVHNIPDNWSAGTDFIGDGAKVRIEVSAEGFEVYFDDVLAYTQADIGGKAFGGTVIDSYSVVLNYLRNKATYLNFGWGSLWDGGFNGTITNVKLYVNPTDYVDTSRYVYYEDYNSTSDTGWTTTISRGVSIKNDGDSHAGYVDFAGTDENSRGADIEFPKEAKLSGNYVVELDVKLTPGNTEAIQFAITGSDAAYTSNQYNYGIESGYILKLSPKEKSSNVYYINGSNEADQSITIPSNTWTHIKAVVTDGTNVRVYITINEVTKTFDTKVNGNGELKGLYLLKARYWSAASFDNIGVSKFHYGEPTFTWSADGKTASAVFPCEEGDAYNETVKATVTNKVKTEATCEDMGITTYTATVTFGENTYTSTKDVKDIPAAGHTKGEPVRENEKAATCTAEGSYDEVVYCTVCKKEQSRTTKKIEKLDHITETVKENVVEASCTEDGSYDEIVRCTECKTELSRKKVTVAKLGHKEAEKPRIETGDDVQCGQTADYVEVYYCSVCEEVLRRVTVTGQPVPHNTETKIENEKAATCAAEGSYDEVVYCTKCGKVFSRETKTVEKLPHTAGTAVKENGVEATCAAEGSYDEVVYCTECNAQISRVTKTIEKLEHTAGAAVKEKLVEATCAAEGSYDEVVYCTACKAEISRVTKTTAKLAHTAGAAVKEKVVEATCAAEGSYDEVVYCTACKAEISRVTKTTAKLAHTAGTAVKEKVVEATCAAAGSYDEVVYCTVCKEELSRATKTVAKTSHTPGGTVRENVVNATCTAAGSYDEVVYCTVCRTELSRNTHTVAKTSHTPGGTVIEKVVNATCTVAGSYDEVVYCTVCKTELSRNTRTNAKLTHTAGTPVTENMKEATETKAGSFDQVTYCTVCGKELKRSVKTIPVIGQTNTVQREVSIGEDAPRVDIPTVVEELKNTVLNKEEKEAAEKGAYVEIVLNVEIKTDVEPEYATAVEEATEGKYTISQYLELDLNIYVDNEMNRAVTLTEEPIQITIDIPDDMFAEKREYVIIREHDGVMDVLKDIDDDPRTITFETDRFSTYAIGYSDDAVEDDTTESAGSDGNIPNTGNAPDMAAQATVIFLSIAALFVAVYIRRRAM